MIARIVECGRYRLLVAASEGPPLGRASDAIDLMQESYAQRVSMVVVPSARLDPDFLRLRSGMAGEFIQKLANYRVKFVVIGDISAAAAESRALRDFVTECNRGRSVFFLADLDAVAVKLAELEGA